MFLAPLEKKDKEKYVLTSFALKFGIFTSMHIVVTGIRVCTKCITIENAVIFLGAVTLLNIIAGLRTDETDLGYQIALCSCLLSCWIFKGGMENFQLWERMVSVIYYVIQMILCVCFIKREWNTFMERAMDYEQIYVVNEKKK